MPRRKPPLLPPPPPPPPPPPAVPALKLTFEKGPLSGQTSLFNPGSTINLGRVARGNTISVKDSGISSKHLRFRVEDSGSGRFWAVIDLGSSNGTLLNESDIEASVPVKISDGDLLKIGEETTIRIEIVEIDDSSEASGDTNNGNGYNLNSRSARGNARNKRGKFVELSVIDEVSDLGLGFHNDNGEEAAKETVKGGECNVRKAVSTSEVEEGEANVNETEANKGKKVGTRGRPKKSKKNEDVRKISTGEMVADVEVNQGKNLGGRITRSSTNSNHIEVSVSSETDKATAATEVEIERGRFSRRVTRNSKKVEEALMNSTLINAVENSSVMGGVEIVSTRRTRSCRKVETGRKATRGRKKRSLNASYSEEKENNVGLQKEAADNGDDAEEERISGEKEVDGTSSAGVGDDEVKGNSISDLEKMSLGEWLDFLEIYLPKQIIDATEEMIVEMRQKAEGLHEFMSQKE